MNRKERGVRRNPYAKTTSEIYKQIQDGRYWLVQMNYWKRVSRFAWKYYRSRNVCGSQFGRVFKVSVIWQRLNRKKQSSDSEVSSWRLKPTNGAFQERSLTSANVGNEPNWKTGMTGYIVHCRVPSDLIWHAILNLPMSTCIYP